MPISESRIIENKPATVNINFLNYQYDFSLAELSAVQL